MNNIYDIILNFNDNYYEVYEWKNTDEIINIRKVPFFKVDDQTFITLKYNKIKIDEESLNNLKYNCLIYGDEQIINLTCLITNGKSSIGVIFDNEGNLLKRSAMLFEEEDEVIDEAKRLKETKLTFIINEDNSNSKKSRIEIEKKELLLNFLKNTSDIMILKYIYYDYYLMECEDINKIKANLFEEIEKDNSTNLVKLYDIIMQFNDIKINSNI